MSRTSSLPTDVLWRFVVSIASGVAVGILVSPPLGLAAGLLAGWGTGAMIVVLWVLIYTWPMDAERTREHATREDPGRRLSRLISIIGSIASLGAVAVVLVQTKSAPLFESALLATIAVGSVAASWFLIQTNYMLRYAHVYFDDPVGGIDFHGGSAPMYTDFIYFAIGLGMTYQVADTNVSTNGIRRIVIGQTVLAWIFATVIIATVINLVTGIGPD
ncbi:MAG TPA: DUF1345 domain-containing protein [Microbacterium sp.]|uniref:DUF1345 domain-containing protein n=1 Tax=Microbacterium sp. TaxID=51671 RepID=UPI002D014E48|nr:DUF1345 domain-containing protein [Microbacterium sp.]HWI32513.1 DUF1345 domain-containing protein [Microbacterium sp.]